MVFEFLITTAALTVIIAARYLLTSGIFYWLLWQRGGEKLGATRLNRERPSTAVVRSEIRLSLLSSGIYAAPAAFALVKFMRGGTQIYTDWHAFGGWPYILLSVFIYLAVQDTHFYWSHRLMHHPRLFSLAHSGHHRSRQPSPFASFAFDPAEAALTGWLFPVMVFIVPIHVAALIALLLFMTMIAVFNHSGWEMLPRWLVSGPIGGQLISATHHGYHHIRFDRNYGLYFRFWDKVMGTDTMPAAKPAAPSIEKAAGRA